MDVLARGLSFMIFFGCIATFCRVSSVADNLFVSISDFFADCGRIRALAVYGSFATSKCFFRSGKC